jgi:hypothetical protein
MSQNSWDEEALTGTTSTRTSRTTFVTERQAAVHGLYVRHQSMSAVARMMGVSQITIRETLVQYQRNKLRDQGIAPPSLKAMLKGSVINRFGLDRQQVGGRPAIHPRIDYASSSPTARAARTPERVRQRIATPISGVVRMILTSAEAGAAVHEGFLRNLGAYGAWLGARLVVVKVGGGKADSALEGLLGKTPIDFEQQVEIATDIRIHPRASRPLTGVQGRKGAVWTIFPHPIVQLETMPRVRVDGLRVQLTTGAVTMPRGNAEQGGYNEVGAVIVELSSDGIAHCRHLLTPAEGDGAFQDLAVRVQNGKIKQGCGVEAINYGDIHHSSIDAGVAAATWGIAADPRAGKSLVDHLQPRHQIFHDVCDFSARSPFDIRNHHKRFAQFATGGGDVRDEMEETARFLKVTRRPSCTSLIVASNHDEMFGHWLLDTDFREDPANAIFFLKCSLALHERLARGEDAAGFFEATLRELASDGLEGVSFLRHGEGYKVAGIEMGIHGDKGPDGRKGGMQAVERLGIRATIGHTHRPTTRGGIWSSGVCQTELGYARGPLTAWAAAHVVTYWNGGRQHLFFHGGRFHA